MRNLVLCITMTLAGAACTHRDNVQCGQNADCDLSGGGMCLPASSGNMWCAYPDPNCPTGYRFSSQDVGDGVSGSCTEGTFATLHVAVGGSGMGAVSSSGAVICSSATCDVQFPMGSTLMLTATATEGGFLGWSNDCHGTDTCIVTMDRDRDVGALFGTPGKALWARQLGSVGQDAGHALATDGDNNVIAVGEFNSMIDLGAAGSITSTGSTDIYAAKFNGTTGEIIWVKRLGGAGADTAAGVAIDASNAIYIVGKFEGTADFGGGAMSSAGSFDGVLVKLNSDGTYAWAHPIGGAGFDGGLAVAVRGSSVVAAGNFTGSMTVGSTPLTSTGSTDIWLASFTTDGATNWAKSFGGTASESPASLAIDSSGNIVMAGYFTSTMLNFGSNAMFNKGQQDAFLVKLSSSGGYLVSKGFGSTGDDAASTVTIDAMDDIYVVGSFTGTVDFGAQTPLVATTDSDVFVAKYTLAIANTWAKGFGGTGSEVGNAGALNAAGDIVVAGQFCGTISFGGPDLTSASACSFTDAFAVRLSAADGSHITSVRVGGQGSERALGASLSSDGHFFATGDFDAFAEFGGQAFTPVGISDSYVVAFEPL